MFEDEEMKKKGGPGRYILGFFALLLLLLVIAVTILPTFLDWEKFRQPIVEKVQTATGYRLAINGAIDLKILPYPHMAVREVTLLPARADIDVPLLQMEKASINVDLLPLFTGSVEISSIELIKPDIHLIIDEQGHPTWGPDQAGQSSAQSDSGQEEGSAPSLSPAGFQIKLASVDITDASITFDNRKTGQSWAVQSIDSVLNAESLKGPYNIEGRASYQDRVYSFASSTGRFTGGGQAVPIKLELDSDDSVVKSKYSGVLVMDAADAAFELQGEVRLALSNIKDAAGLATLPPPQVPEPLSGKPLTLSGLLTASPTRFIFKDARIQWGDMSASGRVEALALNDAPEITIELTREQVADAAGSNEGALYSRPFNLELTAGMNDNELNLSPSYIQIAGQRADITGTYTFPDGGEKPGRPGAINAKITSQSINVDKILGFEAPETKKARATTQQGSVDAPALKAMPAQVKDMLQKLEIPIDLQLKLDVDKLVYQDQIYKDIAVDASLSKAGRLEIGQAGFTKDDTLRATLQGRVANLVSLEGVELRADLAHTDFQDLIEQYAPGVKLATPLRQLESGLQLSGSADKLNYTFNARLQSLKIASEGSVSALLEAPDPGPADVQVTHPDMRAFLNWFAIDRKFGEKLAEKLDFFAVLAFEKDGVFLRDIKAMLGPTSVQGKLDIKLQSPPMASGRLELGFIPLGAWISTEGAGKSGKANSQAKTRSRDSGQDFRWSRQALAVHEPLSVMNADLDLKAGRIDYGLWQLDEVGTNISLDGGTLAISDLAAKLFDGTIKGQSTVDTGDDMRDPVKVSLDASLSDVKASSLVRAASDGQLSVVRGTLNTDIRLQSSGVSPAALIFALQGTGSADGQDITIEGFDLTAMSEALTSDVDNMSRLLGVMNAATRKGQTVFDEFAASYVIKEGIVQIEKAEFKAQQGLLSADGTINLPQWTLDLTNTVDITSPRDLDPLSFTLKGSLNDPARNFAKNALSGYIQQEVERKLQDVIRKQFGPSGTGDKSGDTNTAPEDVAQDGNKTPEDAAKDAVKGVLDNLLR